MKLHKVATVLHKSATFSHEQAIDLTAGICSKRTLDRIIAQLIAQGWLRESPWGYEWQSEPKPPILASPRSPILAPAPAARAVPAEEIERLMAAFDKKSPQRAPVIPARPQPVIPIEPRTLPPSPPPQPEVLVQPVERPIPRVNANSGRVEGQSAAERIHNQMHELQARELDRLGSRRTNVYSDRDLMERTSL